MSATFLGSVSVGEEVPALQAALSTVSAELQTAVSILTQLGAAIRAAKGAIRLPAIAGFSAQISGLLAATASLKVQLPDPLAYVANIVAGIEQTIAALEADPLAGMNVQISANAAVTLSIQAQIDIIDLALGLLDPIVDALLELINELTSLLGAILNLLSTLGVGGGYGFVFSGSLGSVGSSLDAVTPATGLSSTSQVFGIALLTATPATQSAISQIFKVT